MNVTMLREKKEVIAVEVHNAWWNEKKKQGFHPPVLCPNHLAPVIGQIAAIEDKFTMSCDKCHPDMYPYNELPEHIKHYDMVTVDVVLAAIEKI